MAINDYTDSGKSYTLPSGSADAIFTKPDKTAIFVLDATAETITEYTFGTAGEVDTLSASGNSLSIAAAVTDAKDLLIWDSGAKLLVYDQGSGSAKEWDLSPAWGISSGSTSGNSLFDQSGFGLGLAGANSGALLFITNGGSGGLEEYGLSPAYDITGSTFDTTHSISGLGFSEASPRLASDGSFLLSADTGSSVVSQWPLSTAYDPSTAGSEVQLDVSGTVSGMTGIDLTADDERLFVANGSAIYQYNAPVPPLTSSEVLTARYADLESREPKPTALIAPRDVQRSIDTHIQNLLDFTHEWTCPVAVQIDELDNYVMGNTFNLTADAPGLRSGKNLRLVEIDARSALPHVPINFTFRGKP